MNGAVTLLAMIWAALFVLASGAVQPDPAPRRGVEIASAEVSVQILRPVVVRQAKGLEDAGVDAPRPQISRRAGRVLIEFE